MSCSPSNFFQFAPRKHVYSDLVGIVGYLIEPNTERIADPAQEKEHVGEMEDEEMSLEILSVGKA